MSLYAGGRSPRTRVVAFVLLVTAIIIAGAGVAYFFLATSTPPKTVTTPLSPTAPPSPAGLYSMVTSKQPMLNDPLNASNDPNWGTYTQAQSRCAFQNGALHTFMATVNPPNPPITSLVPCPLLNATFHDFAFQVHVTILQGTQNLVGIYFRANSNSTNDYRFYLDFYGNYNFVTETTGATVGTNLAVFHPGIQGQRSYALTVIALASTFYLYLNQQYLQKVTDNLYSSGGLGLFISRTITTAAEAAFTNAEVWQL